jgi:hypothetical protein
MSMIQQIQEQLLVDKKKSIVLGVLICVLLIVGARQLFQNGPAPAEVVAASRTAAPAASATPQQPAATEKSAVAKPTTASPTKSPEHAAAPVRHVQIDDMSRELKRDVFDTDWAQFSPYATDPASGDKSNRSDAPAFWSRVATAAIEYRKLRQEEVVQLQKELAALELQSTMTGEMPLAFISGTLVHEGDQFAGFSVLRIRDRCVVLGRSGHRYELTMP